MITQPLKILIVEDQMTDAALIQRQIRKCVESVEITVTDNILSFRHALKTFIPDMVFSDYDLVGFTAVDVISNLEEIHPNIPVVVITGTLNNEELAADVIKKGASAFLLKTNINSLNTKLEPIIKELLDGQKLMFKKLEAQRQEREKIDRIHAVLKSATRSGKEGIEKTKEYYERVLSEISENLPTYIN